MKSLLNKTLEALEKTSATDRQIAEYLGVTPAWVSRLRSGDFKDPGVNKIENLNAFLNSHKSKAA